MNRFRLRGDTAEFSAYARGAGGDGHTYPVVDRATLAAVIARRNALDNGRISDITFHAGAGATVREYHWDDDGRALDATHTVNPHGSGFYLLDMDLPLAES